MMLPDKLAVFQGIQDQTMWCVPSLMYMLEFPFYPAKKLWGILFQSLDWGLIAF